MGDGAPKGEGLEDCASVPKLELPKVEPDVDPKLPPVLPVIDPLPSVDVCPNPPLCPKGLGPPPKVDCCPKAVGPEEPKAPAGLVEDCDPNPEATGAVGRPKTDGSI